MVNSDISIAYVVISMILIIMLIYFLATCNSKNRKGGNDRKENMTTSQSKDVHDSMCLCKNLVSKRCSDPFKTTALYDSGALTENSPLAKIQAEQNKVLGGAPWKEIVPYDIFMDQQKGMKTASFC